MRKIRLCNTKRILLVLFLVFSALHLVSCATDQTNNQSNTTSSDKADIENTTDATLEAPEIIDFEGYDYRLMVMNNKSFQFMFVENQIGEIMNDAVYNRNATVEELYNIKITGIEDLDVLETLNKAILAGDDICDIATPQTTRLFPLVRQHHFVDFATLDSIDLSKTWWDQRIQDQLGIKGQIYFLSGNITVVDDTNTFVLLYNKNLYENYGFENPYEMVSNGKWTFDKFWNMAKQSSADLDGDGTISIKDQWGFLSEYSAAYYFYTGSGQTPVVKDNAGDYSLNISSENTMSVLDKILILASDSSISMICDNGKYEGMYATAEKIFINGRGLFRSTALGVIADMRDMEYDYGVLPIPKYSEEQNEYYSLVAWGSQALSMPITVENYERTGLITEALAYESYNTVSEAFYNVILGEKLIRDEESKAMLDIVFDSKFYELDYNAQFTGFFTVVSNAAKSGQINVASQIAAIEDSAKESLDAFLIDFEK